MAKRRSCSANSSEVRREKFGELQLMCGETWIPAADHRGEVGGSGSYSNASR